MKNNLLKSPYPYFGGKSKVASLIWKGFGSIDNYVEPFAGSLAVLLSNPTPAKIETVNDKDCMIVNFWRALAAEPEQLAKIADYPVTQTDLHARHVWLVSQINSEFINKLHSDPFFYDLKMAGYWIWGMGASIGNNWLQPKGLKSIPYLSSAGSGIHGMSNSVLDWFNALQKRIKRVRVCCTDWKKIVTPSITYKSKGISNSSITGVFLDPPYDLKNREKVYTNDSDIYQEVCDWAINNGNIPNLRIIMCGYEGIKFPSDWQTIAWKSNGGFSSLGENQGKLNSNKERIYLSPRCMSLGVINDLKS